MQKRSDTPGDPQQAPGGRGVRVRRRLVAGVALVGITVIGAGAPAVLTASADLTDSQRLVTLAQLNRQAVTLAHSLADERDEVTAYIAAGRDDKDRAPAVGAEHSARVDRQIDEIAADGSDAPEDLRRELATVASVRRAALTGKGTAMDAHRAYTEVIAKLQALAAELADRTPARAADAGTRAAAELGHAVEQASATRGLLLAALAVPGGDGSGTTVYDPVTGRYVEEKDPADEEAGRTRGALTAAAQQARVREQAALADFDQAAAPAARDRLAGTVTGPEVKKAETYLARLTDQPELSDADRRTDDEKLAAALTARIEQMRGVESALATGEVAGMERLRDDDVTALELRIALLGGCLLVAIGISTAVARTLTRPLAVLRLGAARLAAAPETEEPVRFTGRNDEFAQVVRSLNTLHGRLVELAGRAEALDAERTDAVAAREALAAELAGQRAELRERTERVTAELERLRSSVHHTFVNLSLRTLGLVERQLAVIEKLEEREQDPERLATLFRLDHMATVMRRHSENLLVLAGHEHNHAHQGPVPLVDVLRAAVSEIERYERVTIQSLPPHSYVAGFAADDLSHLLAELLENATSFSPPETKVQLSGWLLESGEVMLSVQDEGIGMTGSRLAELNARLADPDPDGRDPAGEEGEGLGLRVAALLAARHGVRVQLREQKQGGVTAVVVLPPALLPSAPQAAAAAAATLHLPGSVAEANSNTLPGARTACEEGTAPAAGSADPLVAAAESAVREAGEPSEHPAGPEDPEQAGPETTLQVRAPRIGDERPGTDRTEHDRAAADGAEAGTEDDATAGHRAEAGTEDDATAGHRAAQDGTADDGAGDDDGAWHDRADGGLAGPATAADAVHERAPEPEGTEPEGAGPEDTGPVQRVTDKGLPKRTPRIVATSEPRAPRAGGVDAEALRRRLGGFHRGAQEGRRDAEAEIAQAPAARTEETEETGDTVEEARS
ncbi:nitrate- and nitrite sensing domain-containing protein [Streptomyces sp. NPDC051310]|uniref:sensor histidine kinase n=1 Tax=Streptomyces sp. NPDC051310 TaxID=3365649 RepID=UPI0037B6EE27